MCSLRFEQCLRYQETEEVSLVTAGGQTPLNRQHETDADITTIMTTEETSPILPAQNDQGENGGDRVSDVAHQEQEEEQEEESWYGWLVVAASFLCNMVIDGMGYR